MDYWHDIRLSGTMILFLESVHIPLSKEFHLLWSRVEDLSSFLYPPKIVTNAAFQLLPKQIKPLVGAIPHGPMRSPHYVRAKILSIGNALHFGHLLQVGVPGFYDPCVGEEKSLKVIYLFRGVLHQVMAADTESLRIPKQCMLRVNLFAVPFRCY